MSVLTKMKVCGTATGTVSNRILTILTHILQICCYQREALLVMILTEAKYAIHIFHRYTLDVLVLHKIQVGYISISDCDCSQYPSW
jgi:hypothetical protein